MATLNFNLKPFGNNTAHINAFIRHQGDLKRKFTGFTISDEVSSKNNSNYKYWDVAKQRVKNHQQAEIINPRLNEWQKKFDDYISDCNRYDRSPDINEILNLLTRSNHKKKPTAANLPEADAGIRDMPLISPGRKLLTDAYVLFIRAIRKQRTHKEPTIKKYEVMLWQVVSFQEYAKKKVLMSEVDRDFFYEFAEYLIDEHDNVNKTIIRKIKNIRTVMQYAYDKKMVNHIFFKQKIDYKDIEDPNRVPLEENERLAFWKYRTTDLMKRMVCDAFLCDMYLGLRFGDLQALKKSHLHPIKDGD